MLRIDRQQLHALPLHRRHEEIAGRYQAFLVGEGNIRAGLDRREGRRQSCRTDDGRDDEIDRPSRRLDHCFRPGGHFDAATVKRLAKGRKSGRIVDHGKLGLDSQRRPGETFGVARGSHHLDLEQLRVAVQQIDRACPDRAGRAEQTDAARLGGADCFAHHSRSPWPISEEPEWIQPVSAAAIAAKVSASTRSISPP